MDGRLSRRQFLFGAAVAGGLLVMPELIVPKRTIFLPPRGGWSARELYDLWLAYCRKVVPLGVDLQCYDGRGGGLGAIMSGDWLFWEPAHSPGTVIMDVSAALKETSEFRMRQALLREPTYMSPATYSQLTPWR